MINTDVFWKPWDERGLEHLQLFISATEIVADGLIIGIQEDTPFRLHYRIACDMDWYIKQVEIRRLDDHSEAWILMNNGAGLWTGRDGKELTELKGCSDIDIIATPFTNTLPIRRLKLKPGDREIIKVVYVEVPIMKVRVSQQQYTCLEAGSADSGGVYEFKSLDDGFIARLPVDRDGMVLDYPDLFKRMG